MLPVGNSLILDQKLGQVWGSPDFFARSKRQENPDKSPWETRFQQLISATHSRPQRTGRSVDDALGGDSVHSCEREEDSQR